MKKRLFSVITAFIILFASTAGAFCEALLTETYEDGSFETENLWKNENGRKYSETAYDGDYLVAASSSKKYSEEVSLETQKTYYISFWYRNPTSESNDSFFITTDKSKTYKSADIGVSNDWVFERFEISTKNYSSFYFGIRGTDFEIDALRISDTITGNPINNYSFASGLNDWSVNGDGITSSEISCRAGGSAHFESGYHSSISQEIATEKNKNYSLNFSYKGQTPEYAAMFSVSAGEATFDNKVLFKGKCNSESDWTQKKIVFNSGENEKITIAFQNTPDCDWFLDEVYLDETSEITTDYEPLTTPYLELVDAAPLHTEYPYISSDENNLINHGDLEETSDAVWNQTSFLNSAMSLSVSDDAHSGNNYISFRSSDSNISSFNVAVEPNTYYWFTAFVRMPSLSSENSGKVSIGIADIDSGNYILTENPESESGRLYTNQVQLVPTAADSEWHLVTEKFFSASSTRITVTVRGENSIADFDDFYLFKETDKISYQPSLLTMEDVTITNSTPERLGVLDNKDNLVDNYTFVNGDLWWADTKEYLLENSINIEETSSTLHGKAMHYSNTDDYPSHTYYFKWIDVEPNTEYTFSAAYLVRRRGDASFGIVSGYNSDKNGETYNVLFPTVIKEYVFDTEYSYDYWNSVGVTFNTNDRNRIGIFVYDGGGEAYIDDIRLFKSEKGSVITLPGFKKSCKIQDWKIDSLSEDDDTYCGNVISIYTDPGMAWAQAQINRNLSDGIYSVTVNGQWDKPYASVSYKTGKKLEAGIEYEFSVNLYSTVGWIEAPRLVLYASQNSLNESGALTDDFQTVAIEDINPVPSEPLNTVTFKFIPDSDIEAGIYLTVRLQFGYGVSATTSFGNAVLTQNNLKTIANYDFSNSSDRDKVNTNMDETVTATEGSANGKTAIKIWYSSAIVGFKDVMLKANRQYLITISSVIEWGGGNAYVYAFKKDDSFRDLNNAKLIGKLGEISSYFGHSPEEKTFGFTTYNADIDYNEYCIPGLVFFTSAENQNIYLYSVSLSEGTRIAISAPSAVPTAEKRYAYRIELEEISGAVYGILTASGYVWQDGKVFENLQPDTSYRFAVKYPQNEAFDESEIVTSDIKTRLVGDANLDDRVDIRDLVRLKKILSLNYELDVYAADIDNNGECNSFDLANLKKLLLGIKNEVTLQM